MLSFKLFAGTEKGLRANNEDNFTVCPDLTLNEWMVPSDEQTPIQLGKLGCIMVVADGMGGQKAGEVASAIAIDTVQEMFSPTNLPADVLEKPDNIKKYLKKVISEADLRVKKHSHEYSDTAGMGSTIVIAWILDNKAYIAWLGDSRAYSYIPNEGIGRLSKDHSYVQKLVDAGTLTEEEAMVHQNSNIITRSLGDTLQRAKPEVMEYTLSKGEVILLCSDGLCGYCLDGEIGGIIERNEDNLKHCKDELTSAALEAGGSDNITIALFQVVEIDAIKSLENKNKPILRKHARKVWNAVNIIVCLLIIAIIACLCYAGYNILQPYNATYKPEKPRKPEVSVKIKLLGRKTLTFDSELEFQVIMHGLGKKDDCILEYDKTYLTHRHKHGKTYAFSMPIDLTEDKVVTVTAICKNDTTKKDVVNLKLKARNGINNDKMMEYLKDLELDNTIKDTGKKKPDEEETVETGNPTLSPYKEVGSIDKVGDQPTNK
ncbi:MAG: protein phosphatase 2C domain-containing protein [Prevotellaceae bacterium]|nr:protein phosphatase 2C domain-containing protein [Prevotellaceae bacterium]